MKSYRVVRYATLIDRKKGEQRAVRLKIRKTYTKYRICGWFLVGGYCELLCANYVAFAVQLVMDKLHRQMITIYCI